MVEAILGISAFYHDSAAAILVDGKILAAAQEERFSRIKHDASFPKHAVHYVLEEAGLSYADVTAVAFYEKPFIKFERLLETYHAFVPHGLRSFLTAMPVWIKEKLFFKRLLKDHLKEFGTKEVPLFFPEHHLSHAASAFYPSPFQQAAILTIDGVGEWATTTISHGDQHQIKMLRELHFPHSVGLLYSAFTYYLGFEVNEGEYKVMGLSAYGDPDARQTKNFIQKILNEMVDLREDGSILLNMGYFSFATRLQMTPDRKWEKLFGVKRRNPDGPISLGHMNLALAIQRVTEEVINKLVNTAKSLTGCSNLVLAGGVALNSVANGKLLNMPIFKDLWIQPAAGDAGGAIGAAYAVWHIGKNKTRDITLPDGMQGAYLGPAFTDQQIILTAKKRNDALFIHYEEEEALVEAVAQQLASGKIVGWFQGRMEFGPRALGNRSILGDPRDPAMQQKINLQIKFRESFRPFAPSVLEEDIGEYFELDRPSSYMQLVRLVKEDRRNPRPKGYQEMSLRDRLVQARSDIPAVTHVDYSARIQSVSQISNPLFWKLLHSFKRITGYGLLVNTSFNVKGEPIVCSPEDAYQCFVKTGMDYLAMGHFLFFKEQ